MGFVSLCARRVVLSPPCRSISLRPTELDPVASFSGLHSSNGSSLQALPAESAEARLKQLADKKKLFLGAAVGSTVMIAAVSGTFLLVSDVQTLATVTDAIGAITAGSAVSRFMKL